MQFRLWVGVARENAPYLWMHLERAAALRRSVPLVFLMGGGEQVVGTDAWRVVTAMTNEQSFSDAPVGELIREAMRTKLSSPRSVEYAVSVARPT